MDAGMEMEMAKEMGMEMEKETRMGMEKGMWIEMEMGMQKEMKTEKEMGMEKDVNVVEKEMGMVIDGVNGAYTSSGSVDVVNSKLY